MDKLDFDRYQELAQRTANRSMDFFQKLENGLMGACGEAGEALDLLKKYKFQGHSLDYDKIIEELGDQLWYIAEAASGMGIRMSVIADANIEKLKRRYPEGFSPERSINRPGVE